MNSLSGPYIFIPLFDQKLGDRIVKFFERTSLKNFVQSDWWENKNDQNLLK